MDVKVTSTLTVKVEDGDILFVKAPAETPYKNMREFQRSLQECVRRSIGVDALVVVDSCDIEMSIVKRNELSDIKQRLDDLEKAK